MNRYINDKGEFATPSMMIGGRMVSNPTEDMLVEAGYHEYVEPAKTLADYKADKIAEIEAYDASDAVNSFELGGVWFGGKAFTYPLDTWQSMMDRLSVYASEALNATEQHRAAIAALATVDEVNAYDITIGYPERLVF